ALNNVHPGVASAHDIRHSDRKASARELFDHDHCRMYVSPSSPKFLRNGQAEHPQFREFVKYLTGEMVILVPLARQIPRHLALDKAAQHVAQLPDMIRFAEFHLPDAAS